MAEVGHVQGLLLEEHEGLIDQGSQARHERERRERDLVHEVSVGVERLPIHPRPPDDAELGEPATEAGRCLLEHLEALGFEGNPFVGSKGDEQMHSEHNPLLRADASQDTSPSIIADGLYRGRRCFQTSHRCDSGAAAPAPAR